MSCGVHDTDMVCGRQPEAVLSTNCFPDKTLSRQSRAQRLNASDGKVMYGIANLPDTHMASAKPIPIEMTITSEHIIADERRARI